MENHLPLPDLSRDRVHQEGAYLPLHKRADFVLEMVLAHADGMKHPSRPRYAPGGKLTDGQKGWNAALEVVVKHAKQKLEEASAP
jgi:hypothetical protein